MTEAAETLPESTARPARDPYRWIPWVLVPATFAIYASHPTRKFYFDGVVFASIIEHGPFEKLFNPHHLLYTWLFDIIHDLLQAMTGRPIQALYVMQWGNIVLGAVGVLLMWRLIARLVADRGLALLVTLLGCFSFTYWHYATDADVYILSMCFLLVAADRLEWVARHREPRSSDFVLIGLMQAGSILFHQLNAFWVVCVAMCLVLGVVPGLKSDRWRWWWVYLIALVVPVAAAYLIVGMLVLGHTAPGSFMFWITEYGHEESYWIRSWKEIPLGTLNGYLMVFFHRPSISTGILDYDLRLAMEEGRLWKGLIKKVFGYYSLGFLFFCYLVALYNIKKYVVQYRKPAIFALAWLAPYVLFQFFFMPMNYFYKLFIFVPLLAVFAWYGSVDIRGEKRWLKLSIFALFILFTALSEPLLGVLVLIITVVFELLPDRKNHLYRWGLFILVAFLPLYNFMAGIAPESRLKNNPEVQAAIELQDDFQSGDMLIFAGGYDYPDGWIISALTPARVVTFETLLGMTESERDAMFREVVNAGGRVFIHPNVTEAGDQLDDCARELGVGKEALLEMVRKYPWREGFMEDGREYVEMAVR